MPQLLVSTSHLHEAQLAASAGADIVDLKQPARGSLGAVDPAVLGATVEHFRGQIPLSAALGELLDLQPPLQPEQLAGLSYAKWGLAECARHPSWHTLWRQQLARLPAQVAGVAVVYADVAAASPPPDEVLAAAVAAGAQIVLVDTWDKRQGHLLSHWTLNEVARFVDEVHAAGLKVALAGSLRPGIIKQVLPLEPDLIAVRGAVCRGDRTGAIDPRLVRQLADQVHHAIPFPSPV